ncbi:methyltransferase domain-containing protein [Ureibacillus thermosphaericus]|uniref:methyltransferase domain-containing protein n=1 Tax=Ureibacillus thermosphaericus TaxID=51173 RepID=UPI000BBBB30D|nr:methyltransferase domain-containing protein [Ureibacillus thermosphaericus]
MSDFKVNSLEYWNNRFQTNWESFLGREQTTFFINLLLKNLPIWILNDIEDKKLSICDAGCAEGEGTFLLSKNFPNSKVVGIDFSDEAIKRARSYYPEVTFEVGDINNLKEKYDIIICSNVLEHFAQPFNVIPRLIENAIQHLIIMTPFQEMNRIDEHLFTFDYQTFPFQINNYQLTYFNEIDCRFIEGTHWSGKQAIIIYSNKTLVNNMNLTLDNFSANRNFHEKKYFQKEKEVQELHIKIKNNEETINWCNKKLEEKDYIIRNLSLSIEKTANELEKINKVIEKINEDLYLEKDINLQLQHNVNILNQELSNMTNTKAWRLVGKYYNCVHAVRKLKSNSKKFFYVAKTKGVKEAISRTFTFLKDKNTAPPVHNSNNLEITKVFNDLIAKYRDGKIKALAIIPSAFEFDELYNQRTINLAKYLSEKGYGVLYVAWQWKKNEVLSNNYRCFLDNIYQLPLYDFLNAQLDTLLEIREKHFIITFPAEQFYNLIVPFRGKGFYITYDIMDDWEEFYNVGEAPWYKQYIEEAIIINSDAVIAVSEPLKQKFSTIRNDILVIGNGYNENISKLKNISLRKEAKDKKIHIGYFGHLTPSWFDWDLIFEILERKEDIFIHIIGYGISDTIKERLDKYSNVKFYGKVHPGELHEHVKNWHLGIIPFKKSKLSIAVDPIKVYEYLFFGLPTISTGIPHIGNYPLVEHCENVTEILNTIETRYEELLNGTLKYDVLEEFLENSTWEKRFDYMMRNVKEKNFLQGIYEGE